jgi:hypothetical protein
MEAAGIEPGCCYTEVGGNIGVTEPPASSAAHALQRFGPDCPALALVDVGLAKVISAWRRLPPHAKQTICAIVDSTNGGV